MTRDEALLAPIAPDRRLALSYALSDMRPRFLALYALDARLAAIVLQAREPILAQLKLAWWRERLGEPPIRRPQGEPVLASLAAWGDHAGELSALVDAWELKLGEDPLGAEALEAFVAGRARASAALARLAGNEPVDAARAGRGWALADYARLFGRTPQIDAFAVGMDWSKPVLSRRLRPLAIHFGLSRRALTANNTHSGMSDFIVAVRLGLFGV